jgi:putative peptidoglycan lipid II flippase
VIYVSGGNTAWMKIYSLATVTSASAWINFALLFGILYARNQFRMPGWLVGRVSRQLIAAIAMGGALYGVKILAGNLFFGGVLERAIGLGALVGIGGLVYFTVAWLIGGMDKEAIATLRRRAKTEEVPE